jgi:hypothetical protein
VRLERLPRMADSGLWAAVCETAFWPAGTVMRAYETNRKAAVADAVDADPVAACVRKIMAERSTWTGSAADLLRDGGNVGGDDVLRWDGWPKNPRVLAGRLRRAQAGLRAIGIEIAFSREGHAGTRVIRMRSTLGSIVSTVSNAWDNGGRPQSGATPRSETAVFRTT